MSDALWDTGLDKLTSNLAQDITPLPRDTAGNICDGLKIWIENFQKDLDDDHEVGAILTHHSSRTLIHVRGFTFEDPNLVVIYGVNENGEPVQLLQHTSQVSILLTAVEPLEGEKPHRIGFDLGQDEDNKQEG